MPDESRIGNEFKFPRAKIIDMIRCSVTFDTIEDLMFGIALFSKYQSEQSETSKVYFEIMRCKNGWKMQSIHYSKITDDGTPIPLKYRDMKFNVVFTKNETSIVGEIQFLIAPMLESKKKDHEFYDCIRNEPFIAESKEIYLKYNYDYSMFIAGATNQLYVVFFSFLFTFCILSQSRTLNGWLPFGI